VVRRRVWEHTFLTTTTLTVLRLYILVFDYSLICSRLFIAGTMAHKRQISKANGQEIDLDVLVIGAGPTGLGAAKRLNQIV
jgi:hypothetical protein